MRDYCADLKGYVKLHRKILCSDIIERPNEVVAFLFCLAQARYKPMKIEQGNKSYQIKAGEFLTTGEEMGKALKLHYKSAYRALKKLEESQRVSLRKTRVGTIVTICNWEEYQVNEKINSADVVPLSVPEVRPDTNAPFLEGNTNAPSEGTPTLPSIPIYEECKKKVSTTPETHTQTAQQQSLLPEITEKPKKSGRVLRYPADHIFAQMFDDLSTAPIYEKVFDAKRDEKYLDKIMTDLKCDQDFLEDEVSKFCLYLENPKKKVTVPRLKLRNWVTNALRWAEKDGRIPTAAQRRSGRRVARSEAQMKPFYTREVKPGELTNWVYEMEAKAKQDKMQPQIAPQEEANAEYEQLGEPQIAAGQA